MAKKLQTKRYITANSFAIIAQLNEKGFNATYCGVIPDNLEKSIDFINSLKNMM